MVAVSELVCGLDAELVRLGYKPSTMVWYRGCWRRLEAFFVSRGVREYSLDAAMTWVDQACGGFFDKEQAGALTASDVYLFRVAAMLDDFAVHGAVLRRYSRTVDGVFATVRLHSRSGGHAAAAPAAGHRYICGHGGRYHAPTQRLLTDMPAARPPRPSRVVLVAAAGYGKTTDLEADRPADGLVVPARDVAGRPLPSVPWLGIDDLDELSPAAQEQLLGQVAALPPDRPVVMASRRPLAAAATNVLRGQIRKRGPAHLALDGYATAGVLAQEYAVLDPDVAADVQRMTAGWPELVHAAGDVLTHRPDADLAEALTRPGSATARWVESSVLAGHSSDTPTVVGLVADVGPVTTGLAELLASHTGLARVDAALRDLHDVGILTSHRRLGDQELVTVVPVVAGVLRRALKCCSAPTDLLLAAARSYEADGLPYQAAVAYSRAGDHAAAEALVTAHGQQMLRQGYAQGMVRLVPQLGGSSRSGALQRVLGAALRMAGDNAAAMRAFAPLIESADREGWDAGLAADVAKVHYARGDSGSALEVLDRVDPSTVRIDQDGIEWQAWRVHALVSRGMAEQGQLLAAQTVAAAERCGEPSELAAAHLAMAKASVGARRQAHHDLALRAAGDADDVMVAVHSLVNESCQLVTAGRYADAVSVSREAVRLAEVGSPPGRFAMALQNLGQALMRTGKYGEARWQLQRCIAVFGRLGPGRSSMGLIGLATLYHELGHEEPARTAYLEAITLSSSTGEVQVLVRALAGLARLTAGTSPDIALEMATKAAEIAPPDLLPFGLLALGWVSLAGGDRSAAALWAAQAESSARNLQALDLTAEALELTGACAAAEDPGQAGRAFAEALAIWREGGATPAAARVEVLLGRLADADGTARSKAREAARRLVRMGILQVQGRPVTAESGAQRVVISVLGGFAVTVDEQTVPLTAWRSRQARSLVKILAARRGRPASRAYLCEVLWPGDDPTKTGHRLSVLLATVRGVLDPDRTWPADYCVAADLSSVWLDLRHVALDADILLHDADLAAQLMDAGELDQAQEILTNIERRYRGPAFEDDPFEEWADGFREQVRAAWLRSLRRLASLHSRGGRHSEGQVLLVRLLAEDPFDAHVHRLLVKTLVRAGRHGEARRAFTRWHHAMAEIDAPGPNEAVLATAVLTPR